MIVPKLLDPWDDLPSSQPAPSLAAFGMYVAAKKGFLSGVMMMVRGQPPLAVMAVAALHVDPIYVRPLLPVHLYAYECHELNGFATSRSSKGLAGLAVTPVPRVE